MEVPLSNQILTVTITSKVTATDFFGEAAIMMELPRRHATPFKGKPARTIVLGLVTLRVHQVEEPKTATAVVVYEVQRPLSSVV